MSATLHVRFRIEGRVQGVGFRRFVERRARELGVAGWVRNAESGAVEGEMSGNRVQISEMRAALSAGPAGAVVREVMVDQVEVGNGDVLPTPFTVRP